MEELYVWVTSDPEQMMKSRISSAPVQLELDMQV